MSRVPVLSGVGVHSSKVSNVVKGCMHHQAFCVSDEVDQDIKRTPTFEGPRDRPGKTLSPGSQP